MLFSLGEWGEPFPVYYVNGLPQMIDAVFTNCLPEVENIYQQKTVYHL
jgi:hypothetical protein